MELVSLRPLTADILNDRYQQIQSVYLGDSRPWVLGYSGGKDSTTALQLIWTALSKLPRESLTKPVYVISSPRRGNLWVN